MAAPPPAVRRAVVVAAIAAVLGAPGLVDARGRAPAPAVVKVDPREPRRVVVGTTFGLLISDDGGGRARWVCERAIGYGGRFDPTYALHPTRDEIWATGFEGARVSRDGGCTWTAIEGPFAAIGAKAPRRPWVSDLAIGPDGLVWATTSSGDMPNDVYVSRDGVAFTSVGLGSPTIWWESVATGPRAGEAWVAGYAMRPRHEAFVKRSRDGGASWRDVGLAGIAPGGDPRLAFLAVSPVDPEVVFVRAFGGGEPVGDAIYRTTDGGARWTRVLVLAGPLTGFAVSPDGRTVVAGALAELHRSTDGGASFARGAASLALGAELAANTSNALAFGADGALYAAAAGAAGALLHRSTDGGASFTRALDGAGLAGPLRCPAGTAQASCAAEEWPTVCGQLPGCAAVAEPPLPAAPAAAPTPRARAGCCSIAAGAAGAGGASAIVAAILAIALGARRRRRG